MLKPNWKYMGDEVILKSMHLWWGASTVRDHFKVSSSEQLMNEPLKIFLLMNYECLGIWQQHRPIYTNKTPMFQRLPHVENMRVFIRSCLCFRSKILIIILH